eukprot:gnl/MRDRNA2_/MRDRNA2_176277_c0_seq1.p1 gnl/MRDRNA2_/MRDRNA2_176277_c0~~gnl/MRDRNA2_/MRDRNA2_176277_c0_seq1.p1  ORF type:complete len:353 (+),score=46.97 gnl/MRDRNA2_/MRDRNA2_176277_c0_seq1:114-1061(+)
MVSKVHLTASFQKFDIRQPVPPDRLGSALQLECKERHTLTRLSMEGKRCGMCGYPKRLIDRHSSGLFAGPFSHCCGHFGPASKGKKIKDTTFGFGCELCPKFWICERCWRLQPPRGVFCVQLTSGMVPREDANDAKVRFTSESLSYCTHAAKHHDHLQLRAEQIARNMSRAGMDMGTISTLTGIDEQDLKIVLNAQDDPSAEVKWQAPNGKPPNVQWDCTFYFLLKSPRDPYLDIEYQAGHRELKRRLTFGSALQRSPHKEERLVALGDDREVVLEVTVWLCEPKAEAGQDIKKYLAIRDSELHRSLTIGHTTYL